MSATPNPPASFRARPYTGDPDLQRLSAMLHEIDQITHTGVSRSPGEIRVSFENPHIDRTNNIRLWEDEQGRLRAYSMLEVADKPGELGAPAGTLGGLVRYVTHPETWQAGLDEQILEWAEGRLREIATGRGLPAQLHVTSRDTNKHRIFTLEWRGYRKIRYYYQLMRSLVEPITEAQFPEGFALRACDPARDSAAWVDLYNHSFIDHWDFIPLTVEEYHHQRATDPGYTPDHDLVAVAPDGTFAAMCWSIINWEAIRQSGEKEALLHQIGTRRGYRKMGLGRAMILAAMHKLREAGLDSVRLYVDADNPTGATRLYDSVGYSKSFTLIFYAKDL